jgi:hypothetical protein
VREDGRVVQRVAQVLLDALDEVVPAFHSPVAGHQDVH